MGANFFFFCFSVTQNGCSRMRWKPVLAIEVASVIELSEASGRVAAGLFMTEG